MVRKNNPRSLVRFFLLFFANGFGSIMYAPLCMRKQYGVAIMFVPSSDLHLNQICTYGTLFSHVT